jgi:dolichyl-phosphate-mannose--protein O-mannosyl transferase
MYNYHSGLTTDTHYFQSPWYQWPVIAWPMWFFGGNAFLSNNMISSISLMGNPAVWWTSLAAVFHAIIDSVWRRRAKLINIILLICLLSQYLPWVLVPRSTFIYHYFASVPFIIAILAFTLSGYEERFPKTVKWASITIAICAAILFIAFYPLESGLPVSRDYAKWLRWFNWYNY